MGHVGVIQAGNTATKLSDAELVAAVRVGDDAAFEQLYRRYQRRIRGFLERRVGAVRAEDLTQEAFLSALRHLRASDAGIHFKPWVFEIARNAAIDAHRRSSRAEELPMHDSARLRPSDQLRLVGGRTPEAELAAKESLDHLGGAFDELPPHHHRALVMRELEGLSYREIGERMELTRPAVESTLFRARRRLEHEYEELAAGRRCESARTTIGLIAEGVDVGAESRRLARHVRRCSACRRRARELGVEPLPRLAGLRKRVAALLPLPWLLGRRGERELSAAESAGGQAGPLLLGPGGQVGAALAERAAALLAAAAIAGAGGMALGVGENASPSAAAGADAAGLESLHLGGASAGGAHPLRRPPARGTRGKALPAAKGKGRSRRDAAGALRGKTPAGPTGAGRTSGSSASPGAPGLPGVPGVGAADGVSTTPVATTGLSAPDTSLPKSPATAAPALPRVMAPAGEETAGQLQQLTAHALS